ncbi:MAG: hypothetical protein ACFFBS_04760 [Promethearchaeota archaeon]
MGRRFNTLAKIIGVASIYLFIVTGTPKGSQFFIETLREALPRGRSS